MNNIFLIRFHCQVCQQKLETGEFSAAELEEFKLPLVNLLWKNNQLLPPVECFTSAGKYLDYFSQGQQNNFPKSIEQFITATGPYDIVIDGLNVAYFKGFFDPGKVHFSSFFSSGLTMFLIFAAGEDIYNGRLFFFILGGRYGCLFCETKEASFGAGL